MSLGRRGIGATVAVTFALALVPAGAAAADAACPAVAGARTVPSAATVLGRDLSATPLTPAEADRYLTALDAASPRITTGIAGRTVEDRPLRYAIVGDPRALVPRRLATIAASARAVRAGALGPKAVARAVRGPALVWLGGSVHANEASGTPALLATLQRLASDDSCATRRILHATLAVVIPDENPDGRAAGTRTNAAGFDLNRDWFAATQPETRAKLELLRRYPPTVAVDLHEQTGSDYFTPPYAAPLLAGLPSQPRRIADELVVPAVGRALRTTGATVAHGTTAGYDLLYPGYADSATSLLFGAGGMTFEQGSDLPLPEKARRHEAASLATLRAVASRPEDVVRSWVNGFAIAVREGRAGRGPSGEPAFAWTIRTDRHRADAVALALRLQADGVRVRTLRRATTVARYAPLGQARTQSTRLPAGTIVVPADQPLGRWAGTLLGSDADEAGVDVRGEDSWSLPRLAGVDAGTARSAVRPASLARFRPPQVAHVRAGSDQTFAFAGDSAAAGRLAVTLLAGGRPVVRAANGDYRTAADPALLVRAAHFEVGLRAVPGPVADPGAVALTAPQVTLVADPTPPLTGTPATLPGGDRPSGWLSAALTAAGARVATVSAAELAAGVPVGTTHLVLGPGPLPAGGLAQPARDALDRFVAGGGTLVALGGQGIAAATGTGLSAVRTTAAPSLDAVSVAALPGGDPVGRAVGGATRTIVAGEPRLLAPPGATVALRAGDGAALAASGPRTAADGLAGHPLVLDEPRGRGHVVSLGFSPVFRGQSAGGERALLAVLLPSR